MAHYAPPRPYSWRRTVMGWLTALSLVFVFSSAANEQVANLTLAKKVILNDSLYQSGNSEVNESRRLLLDSVAALMKANPDLAIEVDGYTDNTGPAAKNLELSTLRAKNMRDYLLQHDKIDPARVVIKGMGSANPVDDNGTPAGRARNRRVELVPLTPLTKRPVIGPNNQPINEEGHISFIQNDVSSKPPWNPLFGDAELHQPIYELHRIRTLGDSRTILTFNDNSEMTIGDNTLMIVYGLPEAQRNLATRENIELTRGGLLAKLHSLSPGEKFVVNTPAASVAMNSGTHSRIGVDSVDHSNVSVYNGSSDVSAENQTVSVPSGYGTDVAKGAPPKPPRPLPSSPRLTFPLADSVLTASAGVRFGWIPSTARTRLELSGDTTFERIDHSIATRDTIADVPLAAGRYFYRVIAIDSAGLESNPDVVKDLVVIDSASHETFLTVLHPSGLDTTTDAGHYVVVGAVARGSSVTANGRALSVDSGGLFEYDAVLETVSDTVTLVAHDRLGGTARAKVVLRKDEGVLVNTLIFVRPSTLLGYEQYSSGILAGLGADYYTGAHQAFGVTMEFGSVTKKAIAGSPVSAVVSSDIKRSGNPVFGALQLGARKDFDVHLPVLFTADVSAGLLFWSSPESEAQTNGFTLGLGAGISRFGHPLGYLFGVHCQFIPGDGTRFDPLSTSKSHAIISLDLNLIIGNK